MSTEFYLSRHEQQWLRDKLGELPGLIEDLAVTETRQASIIRPGLGKLKHCRPGPQLPFNLEAAEKSTELDRCLAGWVRFVCVHRKIHYTGGRSALSHGNWLKRHITDLALIDGSQTAYKDIAGRILECREVIDLPADDYIPTDHKRVARANRQVLTAHQIQQVAGRSGHKTLTVKRIQNMAANGHLRPVKTDPDTGTKFYRLGDALKAHSTTAERKGTTRRTTHGA
ncbi:hypothetical protein [Mycobacterium sp. HM-7]